MLKPESSAYPVDDARRAELTQRPPLADICAQEPVKRVPPHRLTHGLRAPQVQPGTSMIRVDLAAQSDPRCDCGAGRLGVVDDAMLSFPRTVLVPDHDVREIRVDPVRAAAANLIPAQATMQRERDHRIELRANCVRPDAGVRRAAVPPPCNQPSRLVVCEPRPALIESATQLAQLARTVRSE